MAHSKPTTENKGKTVKSKVTKDVTPKNGVQKAKKVPRGSTRDWSQYSHNLPSETELAKNGRRTGRNLIAWTRPRMVEKLLLHIEYESLLHNRPIPWDAVAHRLNPGSSGDAITQRLVRMRRELIAEGHLVPPYPQKPGGPVEDVTVRGLVRANPDRVDDAYTTRRVLWTEPMDDLKKPLGNAVYALQVQRDNECGKDEDEDYDGLGQGSFSDKRSPGAGAIHSIKAKGPARSACSTAKRLSYVDDQDDVFTEGSATKSAKEDDENEDEDKDEGLDIRKASQSSSRDSHIQRSRGSRSRGSRSRGRGLDAEDQPALGQMPDFNHPYGAVTPGSHVQGVSHISPYGMSPAGVQWFHSPIGLPMAPMGMGLDMMGGINTTPSRSSAFTTHVPSPAAFDLEGASPRSAAFFQNHLRNYNSPTPRNYADFNPIAPMPIGLGPSNASTMPGSTMVHRKTMVSGDSIMSGDGTMPDNAMRPNGDPTLMLMGEGEGKGDMPADPFDAGFSSMFRDVDTAAKGMNKTEKRK